MVSKLLLQTGSALLIQDGGALLLQDDTAQSDPNAIVVRAPHSRTADIRIVNIIFPAAGDWAIVDCFGYDRVNFIPYIGAGTLPGSDGSWVIGDATATTPDADTAQYINIPGIHVAPRQTSTGFLAGYLNNPPTKISIIAVATAGVNIPMRVELHKANWRTVKVGKG